jgi:hypothetical protein
MIELQNCAFILEIASSRTSRIIYVMQHERRQDFNCNVERKILILKC